MGRYLDLVSQSFFQEQGSTPGAARGAGEIRSAKKNAEEKSQSAFEATVTTTPITWSGKSSRPFLVAIDGTTCCPSCGQPGQIPHHLSLVFWKFWTRAQVAALVEVMRPDERLGWLAKGLVKVDGADGQSRELREVRGRWDEVPK